MRHEAKADLPRSFSKTPAPMEPIRNRVAESDIVTYNLEALWDGKPVDEFDLQPFLYRGLVLREKDFRQALKDYDWTQHAGHHVAVHCSADAIIPMWAYMLVASKLHGTAVSVARGRGTDLVRDHFTRALAAEDWSQYADRIVVIKGCGSDVVPESAYLTATLELQSVAKKLMYGEPCSSVPLWRKKVAPQSAAAAKPAAKPIGVRPVTLGK